MNGFERKPLKEIPRLEISPMRLLANSYGFRSEHYLFYHLFMNMIIFYLWFFIKRILHRIMDVAKN